MLKSATGMDTELDLTAACGDVGDDPGEPGYDPVGEYEEALRVACRLDGLSSGMYRHATGSFATTPTGVERYPFETNAGAHDGGYA